MRLQLRNIELRGEVDTIVAEGYATSRSLHCVLVHSSSRALFLSKASSHVHRAGYFCCYCAAVHGLLLLVTCQRQDKLPEAYSSLPESYVAFGVLDRTTPNPTDECTLTSIEQI